MSPAPDATFVESQASQVIQFTQYPGDTVFVPGGWWHAVLNLEHTIAITQNYCSTVNFARVWAEARGARRGMARKWLRALRVTRPELAAVADELNRNSGWNMDVEAERHARRKVGGHTLGSQPRCTAGSIACVNWPLPVASQHRVRGRTRAVPKGAGEIARPVLYRAKRACR
jgi:hypothetical protein